MALACFITRLTAQMVKVNILTTVPIQSYKTVQGTIKPEANGAGNTDMSKVLTDKATGSPCTWWYAISTDAIIQKTNSGK